MFYILQLEFITNGQLEHVGVAVAILWNLCDTDVVASIQHEVVELVRHSHRNRKVEGVDMLSLVLGNHECRLNTGLECEVAGNIIVECALLLSCHFSIVTQFSYQKRWRIRLFVLSLQLLNSCNALQYHAVHYKKTKKTCLNGNRKRSNITHVSGR